MIRAQLVELTCVVFKLKLTFATLVVMIRQFHGTFSASTNSTPRWVAENNPLTDGVRFLPHAEETQGSRQKGGFWLD